MTYIDKYFRSKADKLAYLELKNEKEKYIDFGLNDIALPIISDDLMKALQNNKFDNEVDSAYIVEGMLYNIGVDPEFKYSKDYINVLKNMIDQPTKYAIAKAVSYLDDSMEKSLVFFRAATIIDSKDDFAAYNLARLLWRLDVDKDAKESFIASSIDILEDILQRNSDYSLAYYELANIFRALGEYIKAMNYYRRALELVDEESVREEIRNNMKDIEADALIEDAIHYISKMNYPKALDLLLQVQKNSNRYDALYYIAVSYMNMEDFENSLYYFDKALKGGADFATLYIDYIYVLYSSGQIFEALNLANEALEKYPADLKIRYNRALIYVELSKKDKALEDLDFILEYADLSDEFRGQILEIRNNLI
ncbi:MAG: tetratricopeptide repeat protein [Tissierellia bacterium]|nr:tetratricopeptide repeat protein [Tissierellia bacterium]